MMSKVIKANPIKIIITIWVVVVLLLVFVNFALNALSLYVELIPLISLGLLFFGIILSLLAKFVYNHFYIKLGDSEVISFKGVINIRRTSIPFENIDNVRVEAPLLSRILGLVNVYIDTPGQKGVEVTLKDVSKEDFSSFYKELREKMKEANLYRETRDRGKNL